MNILSNKDYENKKYEFLKSHDNWHVETSPMNSDGQYIKNYICDNGDIITEINRPKWETVTAMVHGFEMTIDVKVFEHEMFSNKFQSMFTYEKF